MVGGNESSQQSGRDDDAAAGFAGTVLDAYGAALPGASVTVAADAKWRSSV